MAKINSLGVIGNPVEHSLSPQIHQFFAKQFGHLIEYQKYQLAPEALAEFIKSFFAQGGKGLNVTLPYKQTVIDCVDLLTDEARLTASVNTISINQAGQLVGSTTDGFGLMLDLTRLGFEVSQKNILVVGAGGASQSILVSLLKAGAKIFLLNRNQEKARALVKQFSDIGEITFFDRQSIHPELIFDGVISSISEFNPFLFDSIKSTLGANTFCYDLNYGKRAEEFLLFARQSGCQRFSDGLGMLLGQAAKSYEIWTGRLPEFAKIDLGLLK